MPVFRFIFLFTLALPLSADPIHHTLTNPTPRDYKEELIRLPISLPVPFDSTRLTVTENNKPIPHQVEVLQGSSRNVLAGQLWIRTSLPKGATHHYTITPDTDPPKFNSLVTVTESKDGYLLSNNLVEIKLPAAANGPDRPLGPITSIRLTGKDWLAGSEWRSSVRCLMLQPRIVSRGPLFAQVELLYFFADPSYEGRVPFAAVTVRLNAGEPLVRITESHDMYQGDHWLLDLTKGLGATRPLVIRDNGQANQDPWPAPDPGKPIATLDPHQEADPALTLLGATSEKWSLAAAATALPAWDRAPDNLITLKPSRIPNAGLLNLPTWRGARNWLLILTPSADLPRLDSMRRAATLDSLDYAIHREKKGE